MYYHKKLIIFCQNIVLNNFIYYMRKLIDDLTKNKDSSKYLKYLLTKNSTLKLNKTAEIIIKS